ncbi:phospholipase effector Tle1 domain-containing protein [Stutzerimonas nitrititolerans]|uniref:phospholipase effector Tle1 domain-containing protein n=1 Tax=Stutzerimonas nitrititolerans TaxID=2482751 RepID=UPI003F810748
MNGKGDWEKACDHVMPSVCRPAVPNPPLAGPRSRRDAGLTANAAVASVGFAQPATIEHAPLSRPEPKTPVAMRIAVFFDGTGNNAGNTATGILCGAQHPVEPEDLDPSCKPYMGDPDSSYGNDVSNIYKLWDLYAESPTPEGAGEQKQGRLKIYIEGIGTRTGGEDNLLGAGLGRGETGIAARVYGAFVEVKTQLNSFIQANPNIEITSLTFDAFGFSRGAAAARHFANEVARGGRGPLREAIPSSGEGFSRFFIDQYHRDIHMGFIGLFDTVAAVGGLGNLGNVRSATIPGLNLLLPRRLFPNVVQLVARDEHRANFPLSHVKPDHLEIVLPGVHSDIGGGYHAQAEECVLVSPMQALTVWERTDVQTTSIYRDALEARAKWLANGWPEEMLEVVTPEPILLEPDPQDRNGPRQKRVYAALQLKRPVRGELSRVYLRVMYELARQKGVRFNVIDEHDPSYSIPSELQPLCDRFVAGDYSTTASEEVLLKLRYIHVSAHWNSPLRLQGQSPRTSMKLFYINAPTADAVRVRHPHVSG